MSVFDNPKPTRFPPRIKRVDVVPSPKPAAKKPAKTARKQTGYRIAGDDEALIAALRARLARLKEEKTHRSDPRLEKDIAMITKLIADVRTGGTLVRGE